MQRRANVCHTAHLLADVLSAKEEDLICPNYPSICLSRHLYRDTRIEVAIIPIYLINLLYMNFLALLDSSKIHVDCDMQDTNI